MGMVNDVSEMAPKNAKSPILVTELPRVSDVSKALFPNAELPILVTELGMTILLIVSFGPIA